MGVQLCIFSDKIQVSLERLHHKQVTFSFNIWRLVTPFRMLNVGLLSLVMPLLFLGVNKQAFPLVGVVVRKSFSEKQEFYKPDREMVQ